MDRRAKILGIAPFLLIDMRGVGQPLGSAEDIVAVANDDAGANVPADEHGDARAASGRAVFSQRCGGCHDAGQGTAGTRAEAHDSARGLPRPPLVLAVEDVARLDALLDPGRGQLATHPFYLWGDDKRDVISFLRSLAIRD